MSAAEPRMIVRRNGVSDPKTCRWFTTTGPIHVPSNVTIDGYGDGYDVLFEIARAQGILDEWQS